MKMFVAIAVLIVLGYSVKAAELIDVIQLKDSSVVRGHIIEQIPNVSITVKDLNDELIKIEMSKIEKIMKVEYEDNTFFRKDYSEFGASLGTPAALNFNFVHWFSPYGIGISGMRWSSEIYGFQANFKFKLSDNKDRSHSLSLIAGKTYLETPDRRICFDCEEQNNYMDAVYIGGAYNLNYSGFWLEVGLTMADLKSKTGDSYFDDILPQLVFQIGYVYRFIN